MSKNNVVDRPLPWRISIRSAYDCYTDKDSRVFGLDFSGQDSMTCQSFKDECDVNRIVSSFEKTGVIPHGNTSSPMYGDFSTSFDYKEALELVMHAEESFASLPANVRLRFQNDPAAFLDFVNDPANSDELVKLGLAFKPSEGELVGQSSPSSNSSEVASVGSSESI